MRRLLIVFILLGLMSPSIVNAGHGAGLSESELLSPAKYFANFKRLFNKTETVVYRRRLVTVVKDREAAINALAFPIAQTTQALLEQRAIDSRLHEENRILAREIIEAFNPGICGNVHEEVMCIADDDSCVDLVKVRAAGVSGCTFVLAALITRDQAERGAHLVEAGLYLREALSYESNTDLKSYYQKIYDLLVKKGREDALKKEVDALFLGARSSRRDTQEIKELEARADAAVAKARAAGLFEVNKSAGGGKAEA